MPLPQVTELIAAAVAPEGNHPVGSPLWWVAQCETELESRRKLVDLYEDYVDGRHRYTFVSEEYEKTFAQMLAGVCDNWMPLVLSAKTERQHVQGFRVGDDEGDKDAWEMWQSNNLDVDFGLILWEAAKHGEAYGLVWPEERGGTFGRWFRRKSGLFPRITTEHPGQMVVLREGGDRRRRAAAFKKWQETDGMLMGTLYLPDKVYRYQRDGTNPDKGWEPRDKARSGAHWKGTHGFATVPVVPFVNQPSMLPSRASNPARMRGADGHVGLGRSDLAEVLGTQDELNKLVADLLVAAEVGAFRQRYAIGVQVQKDAQGNPINPYKSGPEQVWISPGDRSEVEFGDFDATDLENFTKAWENRVNSMSARTHMPPHYLTGQIVNASGDALKAGETRLTFKVKHSNHVMGEPAEEIIRLGFAVKRDERAYATDMETKWLDPESISPSELADSLIKKLALGVPPPQLWDEAGYSPQQIKGFKEALGEVGMRQLALAAVGAKGEQQALPAPSDPSRPAASAPAG